MPRVETVLKDQLREELLTMPTQPLRAYAVKLQEYRALHTTKQRKKLKHLSYWYFQEFLKRFEGFDAQTIKGVFALCQVLLNAEREGYNVDPCWLAFATRKGGPWAIINVARASKRAFPSDRRGTAIIDDQNARLARLRPHLDPIPRATATPPDTEACDTEPREDPDAATPDDATPDDATPDDATLDAEIAAYVADVEFEEVSEPPIAAAAPAPPDPVEATPPAPIRAPAHTNGVSIKLEYPGSTFEFKGREASHWASRVIDWFARNEGSLPPFPPAAPSPPPAPSAPPPPEPAGPPPPDDNLPIRVHSVIGDDVVSIADAVRRLRATGEGLPKHQSLDHLHDHIGVVLARMARQGLLDRVGRGLYRRNP